MAATMATMPDYQLSAPYSPSGDQPTAIDALVQGVENMTTPVHERGLGNLKTQHLRFQSPELQRTCDVAGKVRIFQI